MQHCVCGCVWVSVTGALWRVYECVPETAVINCLLRFIINKKHESTVEEGVNKVSSPSVDGGLTSDLELNKSSLGSSTPVWGLKQKCHQHYDNTIMKYPLIRNYPDSIPWIMKRNQWFWNRKLQTQDCPVVKFSPSSRSISTCTTSHLQWTFFIHQLPTHKHQFIVFCWEWSLWCKCTYSILEIFTTPQRNRIDAWEMLRGSFFSSLSNLWRCAGVCAHYEQ